MAYLYTHKPNEKSRAILDRAWAHIEHVPYRVSTRWLFYRLLQDGLYRDKQDYSSFIQLLSRVRHSFYGPWRPDTLVDEGRGASIRGEGFETPEDWLDAVQEGIDCNLSHWYRQPYYVECWFEAAAMHSQFNYYTDGVTLVPFGGAPSLDHKWEIAKRLERAYEKYHLDTKILYFGDADDKGFEIPEVAEADIRTWCSVDFDFERVGLNAGDEIKYSIPENWEKPGYQWEALDDTTAGELITSAVSRYVDDDMIAEVDEESEAFAVRFREYAKGFTP